MELLCPHPVEVLPISQYSIKGQIKISSQVAVCIAHFWERKDLDQSFPSPPTPSIETKLHKVLYGIQRFCDVIKTQSYISTYLVLTISAPS